MDSREFVNLQEAVVWVVYPIVQLLLGFMLGTSVITAVVTFFARSSKYMTAVKRRSRD